MKKLKQIISHEARGKRQERNDMVANTYFGGTYVNIVLERRNVKR